ncbi:MAG: GIY-YIGSF superfamily protein [Bacteroidetes bacterium]|nr:MAG: GIY-YIGSF superfamily protein [Bacteroidota bacterium]
MPSYRRIYVYILLCSDGTYYTGVTNNIDPRLAEHEYGIDKDSYTFKRRPVDLQFCEAFDAAWKAIEFEKKIKKWSRGKKKALIEENWDKLKELSVCRNKTHYLRDGSGEGKIV